MKTCLLQAAIPDEQSSADLAALGRALDCAGVKPYFLVFYPTPPTAYRQDENGAWAPLRWLQDAVRLLAATHLRSEGERSDFEAAVRLERVLEDAAGKGVSTALLRREAQLWPLLWETVLGLLRPGCVCVWNGARLVEASLAAAARRSGAEVLFLERGPLPRTLQADAEGVNGREASSPGECSAQAAAELADYVRALRATGESAWQQPARRSAADLRRRLGIDKRRRIVFFPGQVESDSNIVLNSGLVTGGDDALELLAEALADVADAFVVVKPHPKADCRLRLPRALRRCGILAPDAHVHDLIDMADLVVTINSSVGVEAALLGRPVVQLGRGLLSRKGVVYEPEDRGVAVRLVAELAAAPTAPLPCAEVQRTAFFHDFIFRRLYRLDADGAARLAERIAGQTAPAVCPPADEAFRALLSMLAAAHKPDVGGMLSLFGGRKVLRAIVRRILRPGE